MKSSCEIIKFIYDNLKIRPYYFGFVGEVYSKPCGYEEKYENIITKYIFTYQNTCVNRKSIYYSDSFSDACNILEKVYSEYSQIQHSQICTEFKRYVLFSIVEYAMHSISKLLNVCFENREFRSRFYISLKSSLEQYTDILIELMFSEYFYDIELTEIDFIGNIKQFFSNHSLSILREHVEYDHKLLLVFAYLLYYDVISYDALLLCPMLGAVQILPFFNSVEKYFADQFEINRKIEYDYIKYSTYDVTNFIPLDEQSKIISKEYNQYSNVIVLDESLGTGATLMKIKEILKIHFDNVTIGAVEFRWDKKIVWNYNREWFDINNIDYITPISYRHYLLLLNQISCFKMNVVNVQPYIPYMIFDDRNFEYYMSKQNIDEKKMATMDSLFQKSKLIKEVFYSKSHC